MIDHRPSTRSSTCPCGSTLDYDGCCGRLHRRAADAETPEQLMRARYSAYALGELDFVFVTWHPRTRPERIDPDRRLTWTGLTVTSAEGDRVGFVASFVRDGSPAELRELSRFELRRGRWVYVDGVVE